MSSVAREGGSKKGAVPEWAWTLQVLYYKQIRGIEPLPLDSPLNREAGSSLSVCSNSKTEHSYNLHFTRPFEWNCETKNGRILRGNKEWKRDWNDDLACLVVYINFLPLVYYRLVHRRKSPCRGSTTKKNGIWTKVHPVFLSVISNDLPAPSGVYFCPPYSGDRNLAGRDHFKTFDVMQVC